MKAELKKFLEHIANNVGEVITEYHWREASELILQLEGDNNSWIKIESEDDLPKETTDCFVVNHYGIEILRYYVSGDGINCWYDEDRETPIRHKWVLDSITHYQPIIKPKPPIY